MKKLLLFLFLLPMLSMGQVNNYGDDSTSVYLLRSAAKNYTSIVNRKMNTSFCCVAMGPNALRIVWDSSQGVVFSGGGIQVPNLYEVEFIDAVCGTEYEAYSDKDVIYLESNGDYFPYYPTYPGVFNVAQNNGPDWSSWEWDSLVQFGIPDTNMAYTPVAQHMDVWPDSCTGISIGHMDCYHGNPFNLDSVWDEDGNVVPLPDGTYYMKWKVNLPPSITDVNPPMHECMFLANITGSLLSWVTTPPPSPPIPSQVYGQIATKFGSKMNVSWQSSGADHYHVQLYKSNPNGNVGQAVGPVIESTSTSIQINLAAKGAYFVAGIMACNCANGCSIEVWTNPIKK